MKIAFLLHASSTVLQGGSEIQADYIIREILKRGHDVFLISDLIRAESGQRIKGVNYIFLKSRGRRNSFWNTKSLLRILRQVDPDIIYNRWRIPYSGIAAWYSLRYGKRFVLGIASAKDVLKNRIPVNASVLSNWISELLGRYGLLRADVIIAQNLDQQNALRRNFHRSSVLIPTGHPVPQGPFPKSAIPSAIWVANIKPLKQLEVFLELAAALRGLNANFTYVGRPDAGRYQKKIARIAQDLPNVTYAGEVSNDKANDLIAGSSVLVNTSLHEGNPNTFIQAWMRETPVVSLCVNPDNVLAEHRIGLFSGTFSRLVEDVRFLLQDEKERIDCGKRARAYAISRHDINIVGRMYLELFEGLVSREAGEPASHPGART